MKKRSILIVSTILILVFSLTACGKKEVKSTKTTNIKEINMIVPDGLPSIASSKLIRDNKKINGVKINYNIEKSSENVVSKVLKGDVDVAVVPSNVSATQYNKNSLYKIAGTIGWGSFYLISTDGKTSIDDLKGCEIYNIGKGLTPDIIAQTVLSQKGYNLSDFNFSYVDSVTELAPILIAGKTKYAVITEPALSQVMKKINNVTIISDFNKDFKEANNSKYGYPQSTIIVSNKLIKNNKDFVNKLLKNIKESCDYANINTTETAENSKKIGVSANSAIIKDAIKRANINYVSIKNSKDEYTTYFNKLYKLNPKTIGGKVPDEGIFMEK